MSASAIFTFAVLALVAYLLWREHQKDQSGAPSPLRSPQQQISDEDAAHWLEKLPAILEPYRLPVTRITPLADPPATPWQSKFGGDAYWPANQPYPTTPKGEPLRLLAQLNLDEMPALAGYPNSGMLQFFIANDDLMGLSFASGGQDPADVCTQATGFRVVYHPEVIEDSSQLSIPPVQQSEDDFLPLGGCYSLRFQSDSQLPAATDHRFEAMAGQSRDLPDDAFDAIYDTYQAEGCHLGGYATFTQEDPRHGQTPGDWLLLFQMDTVDDDNGVDIMWGDCGVGNFFIHKDDLARRDFSRVWYNWDCC